MAEPAYWRELLARAEALLFAHPDLVAEGARCRGFGGGGRWMATVLGRHRGRTPNGRHPGFARAGVAKYGLCLVVGLVSGGVAGLLSPWLAVPAAILGFYAAEARTVFLFPLLADHGPRGRRGMTALVRRAGGVATVMTNVIPIALTMLLGGVRARGVVRPWLRGCAAIAIWYVDLTTDRRVGCPVIDVGARGPLMVRRASFRACVPGRSVRLLYASDLHLGARGARSVLQDLLRITIRERPDVIVLGGDLVDSARGLGPLREALSRLRRLTQVVALPGNHDVFAGVDDVKAEVEAAFGHWLVDSSHDVEGVLLDAIPRFPTAGESRFRVLCAHDPVAIHDAGRYGYDLVLAGHLHGGQIVVARRGGREFPAAWFYRYNGPRFVAGATTMLVSRGCADTLPFRFRCPREVIICEVA